MYGLNDTRMAAMLPLVLRDKALADYDAIEKKPKEAGGDRSWSECSCFKYNESMSADSNDSVTEFSCTMTLYMTLRFLEYLNDLIADQCLVTRDSFSSLNLFFISFPSFVFITCK